jgi:hypothetical protein
VTRKYVNSFKMGLSGSTGPFLGNLLVTRARAQDEVSRVARMTSVATSGSRGGRWQRDRAVCTRSARGPGVGAVGAAPGLDQLGASWPSFRRERTPTDLRISRAFAMWPRCLHRCVRAWYSKHGFCPCLKITPPECRISAAAGRIGVLRGGLSLQEAALVQLAVKLRRWNRPTARGGPSKRGRLKNAQCVIARRCDAGPPSHGY